MNNVTNNVSFLRTSRQFPPEVEQLAIQIGRTYIDIANAVNARTIGIFTTNVPTTTGESWYISNNRKQQTLRKVYVFGAIVAGTEFDIPVNIPAGFTDFTRIYGEVISADGQYRPLPYVDPTANTNAIGLFVGNVGGPPVFSIRIILGSTAPNIVSGKVILEYLSNV